MSLKHTILSVTRRTKKGFTVGEIFDRVSDRLSYNTETPLPKYSTVRARVAELFSSGQLVAVSQRKDKITNRTSTVFRRNFSN